MTALVLGVVAATALALIEFGPHVAARRPVRANRVAADGIGGDSVRGSREGARQAPPVRLEGR